MNTKYMFIVAIIAMMLISATALATDDAYANEKKKYGKSQATSQASVCGNGELPINVKCSNTASQIQGDDNTAALASVQASG